MFRTTAQFDRRRRSTHMLRSVKLRVDPCPHEK